MRKRNYRMLPALTLSLAMLGSVTGYGSPVLAAEESDVKVIQETETQDASTSATFDENKIKYPDEAEVAANKKLKEVMEQWKESGEYPDYFTECKFYGEKYLCPIIQLTDISEETKQDFLNRVGVEHENWQFAKADYSRNELLELYAQLQTEFKDDARIESMYVPELMEVDPRGYYIQVGDTYEFKPELRIAAEPRIMIHPHAEYVQEIIDYVKATYSEETRSRIIVRNDFSDSIGPVIVEENLLLGRDYKRQYRIDDIRDSMELSDNTIWVDEEGNEYDYDYTYRSLVGDTNGNGEMDLEDAQTLLKLALNIEIDSFYYSPACLRFTEDHEEINLSDAQTALKKALKIDKELLYIEDINSHSLYFSIETGLTDKPVVKKMLKGKEALMEYVDSLDNPELESYLESINEMYLDDETFLIYSTPVYSEGTENWEGNVSVSYALKKFSDEDRLLITVYDSDCQYGEAMNGYFTSIQVLDDKNTEVLQDNMPYIENREHFDEYGEIETYNPENIIKEGYYVIRNMQEQANFNKNIGNGFEIKKTSTFYENKMVVVNVSAYSGYTGNPDYYNVTYQYGEPVRNITVDREKYLQHKLNGTTDNTGVYIDVMEYYKDLEYVNGEFKEVECTIDLKNTMKYTYIDFAPQQQSFVTDYGKSNKLMTGQVRMTTEAEKTEVLAYLKENFADQSLIAAVENADVNAKEYIIAFDGNKGTAKTTQEAEQMYVTFNLNSIESYFNMDGTSFEPGKQVVTMMSFDKGTIRRQLEGNDLIK